MPVFRFDVDDQNFEFAAIVQDSPSLSAFSSLAAAIATIRSLIFIVVSSIFYSCFVVFCVTSQRWYEIVLGVSPSAKAKRHFGDGLRSTSAQR
jgi:hypothetical protein